MEKKILEEKMATVKKNLEVYQKKEKELDKRKDKFSEKWWQEKNYFITKVNGLRDELDGILMMILDSEEDNSIHEKRFSLYLD